MDIKFNILLEGLNATYPSNLINSNINIINDIRKYNSDCKEFSNILVVFEDSLLNSSFLVSLDLFKEVFGFEILFISKRPELREMMNRYGETFPSSASDLNYEALKSIYLKDERHVESLLLNLKSTLDTEGIQLDPKTEIAFLKSKVNDLNNLNVAMEAQLKSSLQDLSIEREERKMLDSRYLSLLDSVVKNEIVFKQFEHILSKDVYEVLELEKYTNPPRILYIKEYQDIMYKHSFIQTLAETVRLVLRKPVKVLMLFDSTASRKIHYVPSYYHLIYNTYKQSDIYSNDFLVKVGPYREVLHMLLSNQTNVDTLIIFDCKYHTGSVVNKTNLNLVLARDKAKTMELGVPGKIIVSNDPEDSLSWEYYKEYKELSKEDRLIFLSSRPIIKRFLETWG